MKTLHATVKKERDLYGYMAFMDSEVHCRVQRAACPVLERAPLMAVMDGLRSDNRGGNVAKP